jgi:CrcB protein
MKTYIVYGAIGLGGALGAMARHLVGMICLHAFGTRFPVGTFLINITGSLFLGWFITVTGEKMEMNEVTRMAIATGFVGAYTTFSTFMFESNAMIVNGNTAKAMGYLVGSVVVGLLAVWAGVWLGESF